MRITNPYAIIKRYLFCCLAIAATIACNRDENSTLSYIYIDKANILVESTGIIINVGVRSNCDWHILETPHWCKAQKTISESNKYLMIEIEPNCNKKPRKTTITLAEGDVAASLVITQKEYSNPEDTLIWHTFAPNEFSDIQYNILSNNTTRVYRISGKKHFVNPYH